MHSRIRVGVLRGGPSSEYEVSLKSGATVLAELPATKYEPVDIFIAKDGVWHIDGKPQKPEQAIQKVDVVFNALHGEYGEDGHVQHILEQFNIPFTGSRQLPAALAMNKVLTKEFLTERFQTHNHPIPFKTASYTFLKKAEANREKLLEIFKTMTMPVIVKPVALGSSVGVFKVHAFTELDTAVLKVLELADAVLIEEFIAGREATCGVVDHFRGKNPYPLFPIEIIPPQESTFFDYTAKYGGGTQEICPGNFSKKDSETLQQLAILIHTTMGLRHYSRSDFIVTPKRGIYFLEVNTLPGMTSESLMPKAIRAIGSTLPDFLDHILTLALERK